MSNSNGIGGRYGQVPTVPNTRNQQLQNPTTLNGVIKSAVWDHKVVAIGQSVPFTVTLNKASITKKAVVEVSLNQTNFPAQVVGAPIVLVATGLVVKGSWYAGNRTGGQGSFYTFKVKVDGQTMTSDDLRVVNDPVAAVVRRNNSDGFDR